MKETTHTAGIFTPKNKNHWWGKLWGREKSLKRRHEAKKERGVGGQSTQPETKEEVRILADAHLKASSVSTCSAVVSMPEQLTRQGSHGLFYAKKKTQHKENATKWGAGELEIDFWALSILENSHLVMWTMPTNWAITALLHHPARNTTLKSVATSMAQYKDHKVLH